MNTKKEKAVAAARAALAKPALGFGNVELQRIAKAAKAALDVLGVDARWSTANHGDTVHFFVNGNSENPGRHLRNIGVFTGY